MHTLHALAANGSGGQEDVDSPERGTSTTKMDARKERAPLGGSERLRTSSGETKGSKHQESQSSRGKQVGVEDISAIRQGGGAELERDADSGSGGGSVNRTGPKKKTGLELPARHWMCTVCKKVCPKRPRKFGSCYYRHGGFGLTYWPCQDLSSRPYGVEVMVYSAL